MTEDQNEWLIGHVRDNRYVVLLRQLVPEFEPTYNSLGPEDEWLGAFEVVEEFSRWSTSHEDDELTARAFDAIERADAGSERLSWNEASGLTAEFCEVLRFDPDAVQIFGRFMGPWVTEWFRLYA